MLTSLALIFLCGLLLGSLFKKLKLPSLIGMLIVGIVLGPHVLNLLDDTILLIGPDLRELALIIILTRAGLSLDLEDLKKIGRPGVLLSFIPACFEMAGTIIFAPMLLNINYLEAALLGAVIASASPAVIVPRMLKMMEEGYGTNKQIPQMILASDTVDDIFNIVVFTALLRLHTGGTINATQFLTIPVSIVLGIGVGIISGFSLSYFFKKFQMRDSVRVIILLSFAFLFMALEQKLEGIVPVSGLLAIMVNAIIILKKQPKIAEGMSLKFSKLWIGAEIFLFVLLGATVNVNYALDFLWQGILLMVIILTIRGIGIILCLTKSKLVWKEKLFCALTGIPKATVQAAIGSIPLAAGVASGETILTIAVISVLFAAPLGAFIIDIIYKKALHKEEKIIEIDDVKIDEEIVMN